MVSSEISAADFVAYNRALLEEDDIESVLESLRSGWLTRGPKTAAFETQFADMVGAKHAIALNAGASAQHLGLLCADIGAGDEVITTPMTFVATINTILHTGARPVLIDVEPRSLTLDIRALEPAITERTKAIVPVHLAGYPCDMDPILALADSYQVMVLEDATQALYASYKGRMVGSLGDATVFSFYAAKNLVSGEGGMITTDNDELAERLRLCSRLGMDRDAWSRHLDQDDWFYEVLYPGYNYAMTDMQAALGLSQLKKLSYMQVLREIIATRYQEAFAAWPALELPADVSEGRHAWYAYILRLKEERLTISRDIFMSLLRERGIGAGIAYIPVHLQPYYEQICGYKPGDYPEVERAFQRSLALPIYPGMTSQDVERVIGGVTDLVARHSR